MLDGQPLRHLLVETRDDRDGRAERLGPVDEGEERLVGRVGEREDDVLDAECVHKALEAALASEDIEAVALDLERRAVDIADRLEAELGLVEQPRRDRSTDAARADDQRRAEALAGDAGLGLRPVEREPPTRHVDEGERVRP